MRRLLTRLLLAALAAAPAVTGAAAGAAREPSQENARLTVDYTVEMPAPATHLYTVTTRVGRVQPGRTTVDLHMPVWTPGSYLVREFERNVQDFAASAGGAPLRWEKVDKNTWRVWLGRGMPNFEVTYRVYANELSVRTSHLDDTHGYFNGANLFLYADDSKNAASRVTVVIPKDWDVATGLDVAAAPEPRGDRVAHAFVAPNYDTLVDSPVETGRIRKLSFEALGKPHEISLWGTGNEDTARLVADVKKIVEAAGAVFGGELPYTRYVFILHLAAGAGGGLEHANSTVMGASPFAFTKKESYRNLIALAAHEYFHLWLVKRIRPEPLGPFDYQNENYTRMLWLMEGGTDYYADLLVRRAGLMTEDEFYGELAKQIQAVQRTPGRRHLSLEAASFDAWIKYYRQNEHSVNDQVSYYTKGQVVSAMLDLEIQGRTKNARSLDDVMRYLWTTYGRQNKGIPEGAIQAAVEAVAGSSFEEFFDRYVRGTDEIDYNAFLAHAGRRLVAEIPKDGSRLDPERRGAWLGATVADSGGRTTITNVLEDSPAWRAGLNANDELLAFDGARVNATTLNDRLADRAPGETATITVFRRDELRQLPVTLGERPADTFKIEKIKKDEEKK
jgi:predicted metalloprotease with PDZ domain